MRQAVTATAALAGLVILCWTTSTLARTELIFVGTEVPARYNIGTSHIFAESDSVSFNGRMLERNDEYRFVSGQGYFDFESIDAGVSDTLRVIYAALPSWVGTSYYQPLPEAGVPTALPTSSQPARPQNVSLNSGLGSKLSLSGSKSFRFSAQTVGNSDFGQSLDLAISGEIANGVEVIGSISDRGFDPAYGTSNSRLSQLNRVNLSLQSQRVLAQVGDITIGGPLYQSRGKAVSGASFELNYPDWHADGVAARPQGIFQSAKLTGRDGFQGPYQLGAGGRAVPIVPGSEVVFLDGERLERGANKDYLIDYPTGRITFNVTQFIDSRSRIEVDYEPKTADYKQELFSVGGGGHPGDSGFFFSVGMLREGDDKSQPLSGDFSQEDIDLLRAAGDSSAIRTGVFADSTGSYILVSDSLPDSVYQYAGVGNGDLSITFSYVGDGNGDYRFLGNGRYEFVGRGGGDNLPVVVLPAAERTVYYSSSFGFQNNAVGDFKLDLKASDHDRNLWSDQNDIDNQAFLYEAQYTKQWQSFDQSNSASARYRKREALYNVRERIDRPDFRRHFFLPEDYTPSADEELAEGRLAMSPYGALQFEGEAAFLDYRNEFDSRSGGGTVTLRPIPDARFSGGWRGTSTGYLGTEGKRHGTVNTYDASIGFIPTRSVDMKVAFQRDVREDTYSERLAGVRYDRLRVETRGKSEQIRYELFVEDSLNTDWQESLSRNRVTLLSLRQLGYFNYDASASYQWIDRSLGEDNSFLGRLGLGYNNNRNRLGVSASYTFSQEQRNQRSITYLESETGKGDYRLEDGQFIPDADGNYIQVEELLSNSSRVQRGEKSFRFRKNWQIVLFRFHSNIEEDLLETGQRGPLWLLPFYSDENQPYQYYNRRYDTEFRAIPIRGFHLFSLRLNQDLEKRQLSASLSTRRNTTGAVTLKQAIANTFFEQGMDLFTVDRDELYAASGDVDGYKARLAVRQLIGSSEMTLGATYREAETHSSQQSRQYAIVAGSRMVVLSKGELRLSSEVYQQEFENLDGEPSYQLTDDRPGRHGALWSVSLRYGVRSILRFNFSVNGRHADNRPARVTARSEMVASF